VPADVALQVVPKPQHATDHQLGSGLLYMVHRVTHGIIHRAVDVTLFK